MGLAVPLSGLPYLLEILDVLPSALEPNACIQHQEIHPAKLRLDFALEVLPLRELAYVEGVGFCVGAAGGATVGDAAAGKLFLGLRKVGRVVVDEGEFHAMAAAELGDGETDARGGAGDEGGVAGFEDGVGHDGVG